MFGGEAETNRTDCGSPPPGTVPLAEYSIVTPVASARRMPPPYMMTSTSPSCWLALLISTVAVATPSESVRERVIHGGLFPAPKLPSAGSVSKVTSTLGTGSPLSSRATAVIRDTPGSVSVTRTRDGLATATRSKTAPGRVTMRDVDTSPDVATRLMSAPCSPSGKMTQVMARPGCGVTGKVCCAGNCVTSHGAGALVCGKPTTATWSLTRSSSLSRPTLIETGVPSATVLPPPSVTMAASVVTSVPS